MCHSLSRRELDVEFWLENLKGRHLLRVLVVDGRKQNELESKVLVGEPERTTPLESPSRRWEKTK